MKEKITLCNDAVYKYYHHSEDMCREFIALQACKSRWVQQVLHIDKPARIIHFVFYPQARALSSFESNEVAQVINLLPNIIRAITHCHSNGWVHGDIKPSNILFFPQENNIRLIDFSASQHIGTDRCSLLRWQVTPQFSTDEKFLGVGIISPEDDWFSLKKIIYQIHQKKQSKHVITQLSRVSKWLDCILVNYKEGINYVR